MNNQIIRETPALASLAQNSDPSRPDVGPAQGALQEPVLDIHQIQGNIFNGFNKDHRMLLFLHIDHAHDFKPWLKSQIRFIATAEEVIAFNRLFKQTRKRRGNEGAIKATWVNIAFTFKGLEKLTTQAHQFTDEAFKADVAARANILGDSKEAQNHWLVGGPHTPAVHLLLIVESDDRADMLSEVARIENSINNFKNAAGVKVSSGVHIVFRDEGSNLPQPLSGHEHFGFLDGVSQPGIRGRISNDPHDVLTLRQNPAQPLDQGKPGQDLLWPGEFVFGYPAQDRHKNIKEPGDIAQAGPAWAKNGSFLVFRRLRQDVAAFHTFLMKTAQEQAVPDPVNSSAARLVGSRLVGRWPSGAPVVREPDQENFALADDDCANNNFEFDGAAPNPAPAGGTLQCTDTFLPPSPGDKAGLRCPFSGHIRKSYPRDDEADPGIAPLSPDPDDARTRLGESDTQTHRLLRRGLPYGPVSRSSIESPIADEVDRGLQFLAYQTSIERQFEFVTQAWCNNQDFKEPFGTDAQSANERGGHDPIIGQNPNGNREFTLTFPDAAQNVQSVRLKTTENWVVPTGGGYFFAPSIEALENVLS